MQTVADGSDGVINKTIYTYGPMGILTGLVNKNGANGVISEFGASGGFGYDGVGNITRLRSGVTDRTDLSGLTSYTYDNLDRLTQETSGRDGGYSETFDYDDAHNDATFRGATRTFNANNQDAAFTFSRNGDPTAYGTGIVPGWDADDNLTSYSVGGDVVMTAGYGPDGLRAWKQTGESSTRRYFVYFAGAPICELDSNGDIIATNMFGPTGLISRHQYVRGTGGAITGSSDFYYTFDPLGHVCRIQGQNGAVVASLGYDAYGKPLVGSDTNPTPYGYGGQAGYYTDSETGLALCSWRYYDPNTGRWLNRDPIGYAGGTNLYAYCGGNPVGRLDPWGLAPRPGFGGYLLDSWDFFVGECKGLVTIVNPMTYYNGASYVYDVASTKGWGAALGALWRGISGQAVTLWDAKDAGACGQAFGPLIPGLATAGLGAGESLFGESGETLAEAGSVPEMIEGGGGDGVVYLKTSADGNIYYGRTMDLETRQSFWCREDPGCTVDAVGRNLTYKEMRGLEQVKIEEAGGVGTPGLLNKINGVSPRNPDAAVFRNAANSIIR